MDKYHIFSIMYGQNFAVIYIINIENRTNQIIIII